MNAPLSVKDILAEETDASRLLDLLRKRIRQSNNGKTALKRGDAVKKAFPDLASQTVSLAEEAMKGMLVLPGTGPEPYFVGNPPGWTFNPVNDNEYTFHLNRMHHMKTLAEAYSLTGNLDYAKKALDELENWIDTVPCPAIQDTDGRYLLKNFEGLSPWRALETGIRGYRTWPVIIELLAETPCFTQRLLEKIMVSAYIHCQILFHISPRLWPEADHNHYLMENLGLMSFACLFPEMKGSRQYLDHSQRELDRCIKAQCTACGGQIEGCPSYHNGCVFWFAMRIVFARKFHIEIPQSYTCRLEKMFVHSVHATRACGGNFPWGDSHIAEKETMSLAAVSCYMAYADPKYLETALYFYPVSTILEDIRDNLWRIPEPEILKTVMERAKASPVKPQLPTVAWQKDLDQVYLRTCWDRDAISLMTGCRTPVKNLHAHIDAGGFDLTAYGDTLVTDPAIYTYKDSEDRKQFKSAFRHNCLTVNNRNMWEYIASWAYGPQKEGHILSVTEKPGFVSVVSCHHNYEPATATRVLTLLDNRMVLVIDEVSGLQENDSVQIHFHLDRTSVTVMPQGVYTTAKNRPNVELLYDPSMETCFEVGKISTANDVWHDSSLIHLNHPFDGTTFLHASLLIPHRPGEAPSCPEFHQEKRDDGFHISIRTACGHTLFRLLWNGKTLETL